MEMAGGDTGRGSSDVELPPWRWVFAGLPETTEQTSSARVRIPTRDGDAAVVREGDEEGGGRAENADTAEDEEDEGDEVAQHELEEAEDEMDDGEEEEEYEEGAESVADSGGEMREDSGDTEAICVDTGRADAHGARSALPPTKRKDRRRGKGSMSRKDAPVFPIAASALFPELSTSAATESAQYLFWRASLVGSEEERTMDPDGPSWRALLEERARSLIGNRRDWIVILARGGRVAAAVFRPKSPESLGERRQAGGKKSCGPFDIVAHKMMHKYVVRAKQGGRQSAHDASTSSSIPKSIGSSMRRENEMALIDDIKRLLKSWKDSGVLEGAGHIYVCVSKIDAKTIFAKDSPIQRTDARVRRVPFATRRPTFEETQRVVRQLARAELLPDPGQWNRQRDGSIKSAGEGTTANCAPGDVLHRPASPSAKDMKVERDSIVSAASALHEAAAADRAGDIKTLLLLGANPCVQDMENRVPYALATGRLAKLAFIRHRQAFPDQWDYSVARIPGSWNEERKSAEQREGEVKKTEKELDIERLKASMEKMHAGECGHVRTGMVDEDVDGQDAALAAMMLRKKKASSGGGSAGAALRAQQKREAASRAAREKQDRKARQREQDAEKEKQRRRDVMAAAAEKRMATK